MDKLIIKVAINEWVMKEVNPNVPYGPDEIAAEIVRCVDAGASVFHFHARDPKTGERRDSKFSYILYYVGTRQVREDTRPTIILKHTTR